MSHVTLQRPLRAVMGQRLAASALVLSCLGLFFLFSIVAPAFLSVGNLRNVLVNNVAILGIVAIGMTFVVKSGGIDLSTGVSVDAASFGFAAALTASVAAPLAIAYGLGAALLIGAINVVLIARFRFNPFLSTLALLFIGHSVQRLLTGGGQPLYLGSRAYAETMSAIARSGLLGIPTPVWVLAVVAAGCWLLLHRSRLGREISVVGAAPDTALYSGIRRAVVLGRVWLLAALLSGIAGILLTATVRSYIPMSGNGYLLDAIGATFIGTTLRRDGRPSVPGTIIGVLLLGMVRNGLLLIGWNFYWQQVGIGVLVLFVLALSQGVRRGK